MHNNRKIAWLGAMFILLVTVFHYTTPIHLANWHKIYEVLYFVPIILLALAYGFRGGIAAALVVTAFYLPHIMFQWGGGFFRNLNQFLMIFLYNSIGALTGYLWDLEHQQRRFHQEASEKLRQSLLELEQKSDELAQIENQLRAAERLSTLGELTASLAHEIRNPLGSIRGVAEILRDESANAEHQQFAGILLKEVMRLDQVVSNYLSYARQKSTDKKPVRLDSVVSSTLALVGPEMRRKGQTAQVDIQPPDLNLVGEEGQLRQVILNVLLNAIYAGPQSGVIDIAARNGHKTISVTIRDQGPGFSAQALGHLFDPFYTEKTNGTGLGLAITKRIVEGFNGQIKAENAPEGGAKIIMEFSI